MIPFLDLTFSVLEFLLELEHFGAWRRMEVFPFSVDKFVKVWMSQPKDFEAERPADVFPWSRPVKRNGPVIRTCEG